MKSIVLIGTLALLLGTNAIAAERGEELFTNKCAICHSLTKPTNKSEMLAPPAKGIMFHMHDNFSSDEKIIAHIQDFSMNPTQEKAKLKGAVTKFGLMPAQKGSITKEELEIVSHWMVENLNMTKKQHNKNKAKHGKK